MQIQAPVLSRKNEWRCLLCCHVRTGTIFFGLWSLMLQLLELIMREFINEFNTSVFMVFWVLLSIIITITMICGAIKGNPMMLIPFRCIQLIDFFGTILLAVAYLGYLLGVRHEIILTESAYVPNNFTSMSPEYKSFSVIFSLTTAIILKGYFVAVVRRCYKYLTLKQATAQPTIHYIESNFVVQNLLRPESDFNMKKFPPPPPSYAVAVGEDGTTIRPDVPPPSYSAN